MSVLLLLSYRMASQVVLATLSIPISQPATEFDKLLDMEGVSMEKARRLATLLGLQGLPTRASLIKDIVCLFVNLFITWSVYYVGTKKDMFPLVFLRMCLHCHCPCIVCIDRQ